MLHEKQALDELHHPFVLTMIASYQDSTNLYFLVDLCTGGELFRIMEELDKLPEGMARFYVGSMTLALQHVRHAWS